MLSPSDLRSPWRSFPTPSQWATIAIPITLSALLAYGYELTSSNIYNQLPAVSALLDPELFTQDIYVQGMTQFNPRTYYYDLILLGTKLGLSLAGSCAALFLIAFSGFLTGLYALGKTVGKSALCPTLFAFLGLAATVNGRIGFADLFRSTPIPATLAMGLAIWGFYFCFRGRWSLGYLLFGLSCLLQFLVGVLPGVLMAIPLMRDAIARRSLKQLLLPGLILAALASCVYVPMLLLGSTDSGLLDSSTFVYLYANLRHPHHLLFSSFGLVGSRGWLNFGLFTAGGLLCIQSSSFLEPERKQQMSTVIYLTCGLLLINYIFVELYPSDLIAKFQFARTTPFSQLMILLGIAAVAEEAWLRGSFPVACLLLLAPLWPGAGLLLFAVAYGLWLASLGVAQYPAWNQINSSIDRDSELGLMLLAWGILALLLLGIDYNQRWLMLGLMLGSLALAWSFSIRDIQVLVGQVWLKGACLMLFMVVVAIRLPLGIIADLLILLWLISENGLLSKPGKRLGSQKLKLACLGLLALGVMFHNQNDLLLLGAIALPLLLNQVLPQATGQRMIYLSLASLLSLYMGFGAFQALPSRAQSLFDSQVAIAPPPDADDAELARLAQQFQQLSPKDALVLVPPRDEIFRYYSQRSVVFTFKGFPFTDQSILHWKARLEAIAGVDDILTAEGFDPGRLDQLYADWSGEEIGAIATQFNAGYILTQATWHPDLPGTVIAQQGDWTVYQLNNFP